MWRLGILGMNVIAGEILNRSGGWGKWELMWWLCKQGTEVVAGEIENGSVGWGNWE